MQFFFLRLMMEIVTIMQKLKEQHQLIGFNKRNQKALGLSNTKITNLIELTYFLRFTFTAPHLLLSIR